MAGITGIQAIVDQSLQAQQTGLNVTANNLANINTPGYSRQVVVLAEQAPYSGSGSGGGVVVQQVQSIRNTVLDMRVNQEVQTQGALTTLQQQLAPVEAMFSTSGGAGLGTAISGFFSSLQQLSTNPAGGAQRQAVITAAQTLSQTFQQVAGGIAQQQAAANQAVGQQVAQANTLFGQIAKLNGQIANAQDSAQGAGALVDQRTALLQQLSGIVGFNTSDGGNGQVTLTTPQGGPLVVGASASTLGTQTNASGMQAVTLNGADITATLTGGSLGGLIQARDQVLPQWSAQLDQLASGLATAVNTQNQAGFTPGGTAGGNLFQPPPATGAAAALALATTNPNAIAASGTGAAGDNSNLLLMENLQQQNIIAGQTPTAAYAGLVSTIGSVIAGANTQQQASQTVLTQLQNQQSAVSGVSLDQESIHLNQFQSAYQAAARVVTVINNISNLAINLGKD